MCGICGFTGHPSPDILKSMTESLYHRGPDEAGFFCDDFISLGIRRLSIVDTSTGHQPVHNEDSSIIAVWNGEIYNYKELRHNLLEKGHHFYTDHSDSEVIVHLYEEYGLDFMHKLNGMFAIALWDSKNHALFLIRDRFGVKPLFYYQRTDTSKELVFSSEIKSILRNPAYHSEMNIESIYQYFSFQNPCGPETSYKGIYSVPPGHFLIFSDGAVTLRKYWELDFGHTCHDTEDEAVEKIRNLLIDSVSLRMSADVEIGAFLSGGLDSSLTAALASEHLNSEKLYSDSKYMHSGELYSAGKSESDRLLTFCLDFEESHPNSLYDKKADMNASVLMSNTIGSKHLIRTLTPDDFLKGLDSVIQSFSQPFAGSLSTWYLSKEMSHYVKTAISGDGADELFGSYPIHQLAFPMDYIERSLKSGLEFKDLDSSLLVPFSTRRDYLQNLHDFCNGNESLLYYRLLNITDEEKSLFLSMDRFEEQLSGKHTLKLVESMTSELTATDPLNRSLEYQWNHALTDQVLTYTDTLSMANSLEVRSPFLDYRLATYMASLPGSMKMPHGESKYLLKRAAKGLIPDEIINRKKEGFIQPTHSWLPYELKECITDTLSMDSLRKYDFFNAEMVFYLLKKYYNNPVGNEYLAGIIWNFFLFQKWCDFYDKN